MRDDSSILVLGDHPAAEFSAPLAWLEARERLQRCESLAAAEEALASGHCAGQVIALSHPGQFEAHAIEALHARAPLAPVIALCGVWCDGEARSGRPWPGIPRVAWHSWQTAFEHLWGEKRQKRSLWLPRLATDLDRFLAQPVLAPLKSRDCVLIKTNRHDFFLSLAEALATQGWLATGFDAASLDEEPPPRALVWDLASAGPRQDPHLELRSVRKTHPAVPLLLVQDFPRPEDGRLARELRPAALLGKPVLIGDLAAALTDCGGPTFS